MQLSFRSPGSLFLSVSICARERKAQGEWWGKKSVSKGEEGERKGVFDDINTMSFTTLLSAQIAEW